MKHYTAREIAELLQKEGDSEATLRMVRYYTQAKFIPELELVNNKRVYTEKHLDYIRAIRTMNKTGKKLEVIQNELESMPLKTIQNIARISTNYTSEHLFETVQYEPLEIEGIASVTFHRDVTETQRKKIEESVITILKGENI